jgi:aspartyl-tRNA(Asn)/glutamyl-tRNA(Gln) amidotransferase subunit A
VGIRVPGGEHRVAWKRSKTAKHFLNLMRNKVFLVASDSAYWTITEAAAQLRRRKLSPVELTRSVLSRMEELNPKLNAFITMTPEKALHDAKTAEREIRRGKYRGPLHGIPVTLKDNIWTKGIRTTAGSKILKDFVPAADADVARRLQNAGAVLIGKTNLHEFAYGITTENPHFGPTKNPWDTECIPGGSSGGSAAALAAGIGFGSVGTDTGGSIRIPAALCGIVGLKPTFGRVSCDGIVPLAVTLDHAGPLARSVMDAAILLDAVAANKEQSERFFRALRTNPEKNKRAKLRLGWPRDYFFKRVDEEMKRAVESAAREFERMGASIREVALPHIEDASEPSTQIALAEALEYHETQGYFPAHAADYGEDVRKRLEMGSAVRAVDYLKAQQVREQVRTDFRMAFEEVDAIIAPTTPIAAPRLGQEAVKIGRETESVRGALVRMNRPANFTGFPVISIPCGFTREGLPVGMALHGREWGEAKLLEIAYAYEQATEWHLRHRSEVTQIGRTSNGGMRSVGLLT